MSVPVLTSIKSNRSETAIVFVHGFGGKPGKTTWGEFPEFLKDDPQLLSWDLYTVGYATRLVPDIVGIWSAGRADRSARIAAGVLYAMTERVPLLPHTRASCWWHTAWVG